MSDAGPLRQDAALAIAVRGLDVVRNGREVLAGLDLDVARGTVTGLLGPSGCGKSTLMRAIVGVQIVAGGEVVVDGVPAGSAELRRRVGYVTQAPSVYRDLSARENLRYVARILGVPASAIESTLDLVDLADAADQPVQRLSGGQEARLSLACALLGEPRLLVLDEPTVGLDPLLRRSLWALFGRLRDAGATLLISSHVMEEALHCDHLLLMREGRLLASTTPQALRERTGTDDLEEAFVRLIGADASGGP